jgi:leader peptidase (prepilin peptidase)/N-methyltransferase
VDAIFLVQQSSWALLLVAGLVGLCVGSFLNVVVYRLPKMMERQWREECAEALGVSAPPVQPPAAGSGPFNLAQPPSRCPVCEAPIRWWQNVPVVSYLALGGRCANCKSAISPRYPLVEGLTGLVTVLVAWRFGAQWFTLAAAGLTWCLLALAFIDADTLLLPDSITLPLVWAGLLVALLGIGPISLTDAVIGAMAGYLILWSVYWVFRLATGKEGMGFGDFKLLAGLGAWLGWSMLPQIILLSAVVGALFGVAGMLLAGRGRNYQMPFGPYLAAAGFIALLWGPALNRLFGLFVPR